MPVSTGSPSVRSSAARVSSVTTLRGERDVGVVDPERAVARDEIVEELGAIGRPPRMSA